MLSELLLHFGIFNFYIHLKENTKTTSMEKESTRAKIKHNLRRDEKVNEN